MGNRICNQEGGEYSNTKQDVETCENRGEIGSRSSNIVKLIGAERVSRREFQYDAAGYYVMFYCSTWFYLNHLYGSMLSKYDFWLADWTDLPFNLRSFGIHQYTNSGKIDGINGNVDLNIAFKNYPTIIGGVKEKYTFTDLKTNIMKELDRYESLLG